MRTSTGSFSLDVEGADLRTCLKAISEFSGRNIVMGQNVHATVRIRCRTWAGRKRSSRAARSGLDFVEEGGMIRVDETSKLNAEKVERDTANARTLEGAAGDPRDPPQLCERG